MDNNNEPTDLNDDNIDDIYSDSNDDDNIDNHVDDYNNNILYRGESDNDVQYINLENNVNDNNGNANDNNLSDNEELYNDLENAVVLNNNIINEIFNDFNNNNYVNNINIMDNYNNIINNNIGNNIGNNNIGNNNVDIIDPMIIYGMRLLYNNNNNNDNAINVEEKMNQINEYLEFCNDNNMILYINFEILNIIHNIFIEFYTSYIAELITYDLLIKNTIKKCFNVLISSGQTIKDSTIYIITYVNFCENYSNTEDLRYNNCLFFNYKILVIEDIKKYLLSFLIIEDLTNALNLQYTQNLEDVKCVLNNETLNNIPIVIYSETSDEIKNINNYCAVCREIYNADDHKKLRILKCNHLFCCECIDPWLLNHSHKCPNCRVEMDGHIHI